MSKIMCIIDGMADSNFRAENYPALASFPEKSFVNTIPTRFEAETLPCVLFLLGIKRPPKNIRGWIEALGAGIDVAPNDLVFRGSWVKLNGDGICIGFCDAPENIPNLKRAKYKSLNGYKSLLIFPDCARYVKSAQTDLPFNLFGKSINDYVYPDIQLLKETLARINGIDACRAFIPWAASTVSAMPSLPNAAAVCGTNAVKGIAKALNMYLVTTYEMTGDTDTNLQAKLRAALELAEKFSFVLLHIGGCDEAAHRMNKTEKETFLSNVDSVVLSGLLSANHIIKVVSDHGCDPQTGRHTGGNQPMFYRG